MIRSTAGRLRIAVALLAVVTLLTACEPESGQPQRPNPQVDRYEARTPTGRTLTLIWYSDQPYKARWAIGAARGEQPPKGLNPLGEESVARGEFKKPLLVGPKALLITITVIMSTKDATGWVKIMEGSKELRFEPADRGTRQGAITYQYTP